MALASQDWDRDEDHLALVAELLDGLPDKERVGGGAAGDQSCVTRRNHGKKTHRLWGMNIYIILYLQIIYTWHIISYIIYTIYYIYLFIIHAYTSIKTWEKYSSLGNEDHVLNTAGFHFDRRRLRTSACLESIPRRRTVCGCLVMWIMWYVPGLVMTHSLRHWTWPYIEIVDLPSYKMLDLSMFKVTRGYQRVCFTIIHRIYMTQMWKVHMWIGSDLPHLPGRAAVPGHSMSCWQDFFNNSGKLKHIKNFKPSPPGFGVGPRNLGFVWSKMSKMSMFYGWKWASFSPSWLQNFART